MTDFQIGDLVYVGSEADVHGTIIGIRGNLVLIDVMNGNSRWPRPKHLVSLTYRKSPMDDGALEYEEIMQIQEMKV